MPLRIGPPATLGLIVAVGLAAGAACGGASGGGAGYGPGTTAQPLPPAPPRWQDDLSLLLPPDATLVARVDAARLRASPYYPILRDLAARHPQGRDVVASALEGADELWLAVRARDDGGDPDLVVVGRGPDLGARIDADAPRHGFVSRERVSGVDVMREVSGARAAIVLLSADTRVLTRGEEPEAVLARAEARAPRGPFDARSTLTGLASRVGMRDASVAVVATLPPSERARLRQRRGLEASIADARAVAARLEASDGVLLEITADMESVDAAARARNAVTAELDRLAGNPVLALMGLRDVVARARVSSRGDRLDAVLHLSDAEVRSLLQRFGPLSSRLGTGLTRTAPNATLVDAAPPRTAGSFPAVEGAR
jgi:hypothetical protein